MRSAGTVFHSVYLVYDNCSCRLTSFYKVFGICKWPNMPHSQLFAKKKKPRLHDNQVWKRLVTYCIWCLGSTWVTLRERFYNLHHTRIMNVVQYILKYWAQRFKQMFVSCTLLIPLYDAYVILFLRGWGGIF